MCCIATAGKVGYMAALEGCFVFIISKELQSAIHLVVPFSAILQPQIVFAGKMLAFASALVGFCINTGSTVYTVKTINYNAMQGGFFCIKCQVNSGHRTISINAVYCSNTGSYIALYYNILAQTASCFACFIQLNVHINEGILCTDCSIARILGTIFIQNNLTAAINSKYCSADISKQALCCTAQINIAIDSERTALIAFVLHTCCTTYIQMRCAIICIRTRTGINC